MEPDPEPKEEKEWQWYEDTTWTTSNGPITVRMYFNSSILEEVDNIIIPFTNGIIITSDQQPLYSELSALFDAYAETDYEKRLYKLRL